MSPLSTGAVDSVEAAALDGGIRLRVGLLRAAVEVDCTGDGEGDFGSCGLARVDRRRRGKAITLDSAALEEGGSGVAGLVAGIRSGIALPLLFGTSF